jgi:tRNA G26 N,N-dimethylase Trm1
MKMKMKFNKTDDELKHMSDDELFEYLDAKAAHLKKHTAPLSSYQTKRFAHIGQAISNGNKGTDNMFENLDYNKVKEIADEHDKMGKDILINKIKTKQNG